MVLGSNLSSPSAPLNGSVRNIQQSNLSTPGAVSGSDRGVNMLASGNESVTNSMGMTCGINRCMLMSRPGFRGMTSSSMPNSGSVLSSNMAGMPSPGNMHSGPGSGQVNSMLRPQDTMHIMRPGHILENKRQLPVPELQMQAQENIQGIPAFDGLNSAYPNQSTALPIQPNPGHPQQSNVLNNSHHARLQCSNGSQQQAYAVRLTKERQMQQQQCLVHQQQQQFAASSALKPHVEPPTQLPISSLQSNSQVQSLASTQAGAGSPLTPSLPITPMSLQQQQKHHLAPQGLGRNPYLVLVG